MQLFARQDSLIIFHHRVTFVNHSIETEKIFRGGRLAKNYFQHFNAPALRCKSAFACRVVVPRQRDEAWSASVCG